MSASGDEVIKQRTRVSVVPVNGDWSPAYKAVEEEMVARRGRIKREMMQGRVFEPAFYFSKEAKPSQLLSFAASLPSPTAAPVAQKAQPAKAPKAQKASKSA